VAPISPAAVAGTAAVRSAASDPLALTAVKLSGPPAALVDDAADGKVFVVVSDVMASGVGTVVTLRAKDGKVLGSTSLTGASNHLQAVIICPTCMALDTRSGRVFVLSSYLNASSKAGGIGSAGAYVFMLDTSSGRIENAAALSPANPSTGGFWPYILVDESANRVLSTSGPNNRLSVLDATTGKLLHTVRFPNADPDPQGIEPLAVDRHDGGVLVEAPEGLVLVDEHTGNPLRTIHLPDGQGLASEPPAVVDGQRGRAVVSVDSPDPAHGSGYAVETLDLAHNKLVGTPIPGGNTAATPLLLDQQTGLALVVDEPADAPDQSNVSIVDDTTGKAISGVSAAVGQGAAGITAAVNPITGHGLVVQAAGQFQGPIILAVEDLHTGAQLSYLTIAGETDYATPGIVVDGPTRHVFVTDPSENSVIMYDASKL